MVLAQIIRGGHKIADVGGEIGIGELSLAAAYAGEVEAQHGDVASCQTCGNPRRCEGILAAGEAVSKQGESARLGR